MLRDAQLDLLLETLNALGSAYQLRLIAGLLASAVKQFLYLRVELLLQKLHLQVACMRITFTLL